jgi:hypothetical protein
MPSLLASFDSNYNGCACHYPTLEELLGQCSANGGHASGDEDAAQNESDHRDY